MFFGLYYIICNDSKECWSFLFDLRLSREVVDAPPTCRCGFEQPELVEGVSWQGGAGTQWSLRVPSNPNHSDSMVQFVFTHEVVIVYP